MRQIKPFEKILAIAKAKETKKHSDELLESNWIETSNEFVINRGETIIIDNLTELQAEELLDIMQAECNE
ncbi:hypothetical protein [Priestia megaterium]|uniref:hypothetical protein n=1 Tax=Priestia megaterium TaxID=1404 RepID=UPI000BFE996B|nr:hypothetical protein [Priestia megaterium]PGO60666.1 hypothetical protein CN981_08945 [Priestia megaterium]